MIDKRIVYSVHGTWWDSINKAGKTSSGLPCCPLCGSVLFEIDSEQEWYEAAQKYEDAGHPGYVDMLRWSRGKCFPNLIALELAYEAYRRAIT